MGGLTAAELASAAERWVVDSCAAQGVPVHVNDPATIQRVAQAVCGASDAPDRRKAPGLEAVQAADCGVNDHAV